MDSRQGKPTTIPPGAAPSDDCTPVRIPDLAKVISVGKFAALVEKRRKP